MEKTTTRNVRTIYWFAYYNCNSPSVRYRAYYPLIHLRQNYSVKTHLVIPGYHPFRMFRFIWLYFSAMFASPENKIVIQRISSDWIYATALKILVRIRKNVYYDLDDADYLLGDPSSIYYFVKHSSRVIAGSESIAQHLSAINPNVSVNTSPAPEKFITKQKRNEKFVIGWVGEFGGEHKESLYRFLFPAVRELNFPSKLMILGITNARDKAELADYFNACDSVELSVPERIDWMDESTLQQELACFDVGIATLMDSEMHRAKSGFKVKQYLNNGVPVLCNDLRENNRYITNGFNGFLCNSPEEFRDKLIHIRQLTHEDYTQLSVNALQSSELFSIDKYCTALCSRINRVTLFHGSE